MSTVRGLLLLGCLSLIAPAARASAPLTLFESSAPRSLERAFIARLSQELRLLGIEVDVQSAPSATPDRQLEAWTHDAGHGAAMLRYDANGASLLFVPPGGGAADAFALGNVGVQDADQMATQAAEMLRPKLLDDVALGAPPSSSDAPVAAVQPAPGGASTSTDQPADADRSAPLRSKPADALAMADPPRFVGELGVGLLLGSQVVPPQATFSARAAIRISRRLRVELWALAPLHRMVHQLSDATIYARASVLGAGLELSFYRQPRWELAGAIGAGPAVVARTPSGDDWTRSVSLAVDGRLTAAIQLAHALALRLDVTLGTLLDEVRLTESGGPSWGRVWLGTMLALRIALP